MKKLLGALFFTISLLTSMANAQVPGISSSMLNAVSEPKCSTKIVPFDTSGGRYPKVVMQGDSITAHNETPGIRNSTTNTANVSSFTTTSGSAIITYNGTDLATIGPYTNEAISGTGIPAGTVILQALDSTHLLLSANATTSATNNLSIAVPQTGTQAFWNIQKSLLGELATAQAYAPYFRYDTWNDVSRNWGAPGNSAELMRGANLGYAGGNTRDLLSRWDEYKYLDPDILIFSVGVNNITSATFKSDMEQLVDRAHAWCPSLPIFLTNIRATATSVQSSRQPGGIVYDNSLIDNIVTARPWLKKIDLFTPYANNSSTSSGVSIPSVFNTTIGNATIAYTGVGDLRQFGPQIGQTVTGAAITGTPTVSSVGATSLTISSGAAVTSSLTNTSLTFTPFAFANQTGNDLNYSVTYPANSGDGLHPGVLGAQTLGAPAIQTAICSVIVGNCAASTTHNVFLDNPNISILTINPASLLTGTASAINKSTTGTGQVSTTGTWLSADTSMTVASATGLTIGQAITSASGLSANTYVTNIVGTTITFSPASSGAATDQAVTFSPGVSGQTPQGTDLAISTNTFTSYVSSVSANAETGGNMQTIKLYPSGSANTENLTWRPTAIAISSTGCLAHWCQMWAELEVDQNAGWVSITSKPQERLAAYSNNYFSQGQQGIIPVGAGNRRAWVSSECFAYPFNSSGITPSIVIQHSPLLDTGNPTIIVRRWDIRVCDAPPSKYKVQN